MKILVIEDDPINLKLAHLVLSSEGHNVVDAKTAENALEVIKKNKPQAILVDLALPGMDGLSLVRQLKQDPETRDIPIIGVTAYPDRFSKKEAIEAGCDVYIIKPIDTRILPKQVAEVGLKNPTTDNE
ncbi:MAG: response regulator [Nitrospira sp.]|nr:response regulator [Nitrospira sp.]